MLFYRFARLSVITSLLLIPGAAQAGGNVLAFAGPDGLGGNTVLVIAGDNEANEIRVTEAIPGHALVEGLNGTTVNGQPSDEVVSTADVFFGTDIALGNGDDRLTYEYTVDEVGGSKQIRSGKGDDFISLTIDRAFASSVFIETDSGNDDVSLRFDDSAVVGSVAVDTGSGDDLVLFQADRESFLIIGAAIETGQGDDIVQIQGEFRFLEPVTVFLAQGNDLLVGDPDADLPAFALEANGGTGFDSVLNSNYFPIPFFLSLFEFLDGE